MHTSKIPLYSTAQVREFDQIAIDEYGVEAYTLMQRAGEASLAVLRKHWPSACKITVVCGTGNNGGDGYVLARLASTNGLQVVVLQIGSGDSRSDTASVAYHDMRDAGLDVQLFDPGLLQEADVIVDALLGSGISRDVEGVWLEAVEHINRSGVRVLALDVPSGMDGDTGMPKSHCVQADCTISFVGRKKGLFTGKGPECCGQLAFDSLAVSEKVFSRCSAEALCLTEPPLGALRYPRARDTHKGICGHVLLIGGDTGMSGAVRLAAEAAARTGSGLVSVATRNAHAAQISATCPEIMSFGVEEPQELDALLSRASVVAIGPGLGRSVWANTLMARVLETKLPLVVDADALNNLAESPVDRGNWILTPHPGEAARLLGSDTSKVQFDRFSSAENIAKKFKAICVLKGSGSLIAQAGTPTAVIHVGNPGMASGGMGDVLTGVIAGLVAQGLSLSDAAMAGAFIHGAAGDLEAARGERGMLASDLLPHIRDLLNP